jgi:hypothetical protein
MQGAFGRNAVSRDAVLAAAMVSRVTQYRDSTTPNYTAMSTEDLGRSEHRLLAVAVITPSSRFVPDARLRVPRCMRQ